MSPSRAILTGSLLVALALVAAKGIAPAAAALPGPYILMQHSNTTANVGVFRLDTTTGEVSYCYMSNNNNLACTAGVR